MMDNFWFSFAAVFVIFLSVEMILSMRRSRELKSAQKFLHLAKREALEMAGISLGNPFPLIQISDKGDVIFINPAAFEKFPGIREQGFQHPVLSGLGDIISKNKADSREIGFGGLVYNQTIAPTRVNDQTAFTIYCYDVTERKAYEKMLQESREMAEKAYHEAEKANQARGDFLANMSHELRTPMNCIIGLSDILIEEGLKQKHQEMIEALNSSAHHLLNLLNDILDFSKIEAGELTLESISFDLRRVIKQIEFLQSPVAASKGLEMKSKISDAVPQRLLGDPARLQQILNNLIGNALKFTAEGSVTVSVDGEADGNGSFTTHISVTDTGIGIPKDQQGKLFRKFQQADVSTSRKYGGTGLGLAISKNLAELMGGSIALKSDEGKGTTFTVTIPAKIVEPGEMDGGEHKAGTARARINKKAKIMVVDDHPINLLFMRQALGKLGLENFDEASSGRQAIELFKKGHYDLILMDCQMPDMDGYEASRQIHQLKSGGHKSAIIAVTANAMKGAEEKCMAAGMNDYISKPVDKEKLKILLQRWLPGDDAAQETDVGTEEKKNPVAPQETKILNESREPLVVFDWDHLYEYTNGDKETENMLINMFLENLEIDLKNMKKSFRDKNFNEWEAIAHKLHGASAHMGAYALADLCDQAQSLSSEEIEKTNDLHQLILNESRRLHGLLEKNGVAA